MPKRSSSSRRCSAGASFNLEVVKAEIEERMRAMKAKTEHLQPNSNVSRFNGLDFSSEVGPKSFHQLAHPSDEVRSLHGFEQLRGKVVGLKMKDAIPTPAERLDIRRRQERVDPGINQFLNQGRYLQPPGVFGPPLAQIVFDEQTTNVETILETFYERCLAGRPEAVRIFIEEDLVSRSGLRLQNERLQRIRRRESGMPRPVKQSANRCAMRTRFWPQSSVRMANGW